MSGIDKIKLEKENNVEIQKHFFTKKKEYSKIINANIRIKNNNYNIELDNFIIDGNIEDYDENKMNEDSSYFKVIIELLEYVKKTLNFGKKEKKEIPNIAIVIYIDNIFIVNCINEWIYNWAKNNFYINNINNINENNKERPYKNYLTKIYNEYINNLNNDYKFVIFAKELKC